MCAATVIWWSSDGGRTFFNTNFPLNIKKSGISFPKIAIGPDVSAAGVKNVWVAYQDGVGAAKGVYAIGAQVSYVGIDGDSDFIGNFSPTPRVVDVNGSILGDIVLSPVGHVVVCYLDGLGRIQSAVNTTGTAGLFTMTNNPSPIVPRVVAPKFIPAQNARGISASLSLAYDYDDVALGRVNPATPTLYMAYTDAPAAASANTNVFLVSSTNNGASWTAPLLVNDIPNDPTSFVSSQFLPRIAVDQFTGNLAVTYYDCRNDLGSTGSVTAGANNDAQLYASFARVRNGKVIFQSEIVAAVEDDAKNVTITTNGPHGFKPGIQVFITGLTTTATAVTGLADPTLPVTVPPRNPITGYVGAVSITGVTDFTFTFTTTQSVLPVLASNATVPVLGYATAPIRLSAGTSSAALANTENQQVQTTPSPIDYGDYIGSAFYNSKFIATWSDNSNSTFDNPSLTGQPLGLMNLYTDAVNVVTIPSIAVDPKAKPDLTISNIQIVDKPVAGFPFRVYVTVFNKGLVDSGAFFISLFASPGDVGILDLTQTDFSIPDAANPNKVDIKVVNGLASGSSVIVLVTMLCNFSGDTTIAALADSHRDIVETDELNNVLTKRLLVFSKGIDIVARATANLAGVEGPAMVATVPLGGIPGINAHFDYTLFNMGIKPAGAFRVVFYNSRLSPPTLADAPDQTALKDVPGLASGTFYQSILNGTSFDLTTNIARGGRAWILADDDKGVKRVNETAPGAATNNTASAIWGVPNQAPAILSAAFASFNGQITKTVEAGDTVTFSVGAGDPEGDPLFYTWNFGDGTPPIVGGATITHAFAAPGMYNVTVTVADGPFTNVQSVANLEVLDDLKIDLGFVIAKAGYIKLAVPLPPGVTKKMHAKATIVQGTPGLKVKFKAQRLTGRPGSASPIIPNTFPVQYIPYTFTVEYLAPKSRVVKRVRYSYVVLN